MPIHILDLMRLAERRKPLLIMSAFLNVIVVLIVLIEMVVSQLTGFSIWYLPEHYGITVVFLAITTLLTFEAVSRVVRLPPRSPRIKRFLILALISVLMTAYGTVVFAFLIFISMVQSITGNAVKYPSPDNGQLVIFREVFGCDVIAYEERGLLRREADFQITSDISSFSDQGDYRPCRLTHHHNGFDLRWDANGKGVSWKAQIEDQAVEGVVIFK